VRAFARLPLLVVLAGIAAVAMYVPAAHALALREHAVARAFFYWGTLLLVVVAMVALASRGHRPRDGGRGAVIALAGSFALLPPMLALPFHEAVGDTTFARAWFEMVSSLTTTGATLYDAPGRLPLPVQLWRGIVGWMGGAWALVAAFAILAPLALGGFEVAGSGPATRAVVLPGEGGGGGGGGGRSRLARVAVAVLPVYAGATGALWVALLIAGDAPTAGLMRAMATLATSGIVAEGAPAGGAGRVGEMLVAVFLLLALSRNLWPLRLGGIGRQPVLRDPELRLAAAIVVAVPLLLFVRHFIGALADPLPDAGLGHALRALWGGLFTVLSFLATDGHVSADWAGARLWSGFEAPGLILVGLALVGGGVATTAGGVKLLRVLVLGSHTLRETARLVHPSSLGRSGAVTRRLRREGAFAAWIALMLYAATISAALTALGLAGVGFEAGLVYTLAALTTTGPLVEVAAVAPLSFGDLGGPARAVLAVVMVLGRLEALALVALVAPDLWRR